MPKVRLTDITIRNLSVPEEGQVMHWCDNLPGFGVRVSQGGIKTFCLVHGKGRTRTTLGRYPVVTLAEARQRARELLAQKMLGQEKPKTVPFEDALTEFFTVYVDANTRPKSAYETKRVLNRHLLPKLKGTALGDVKTGAINKIYDKLIDRPSELNHLHTAAAQFFNWCAKVRKYIPQSPLDGIGKPATTTARSRVLTDDELKALWSALQSTPDPFASIVKLLLLTGQRRTEIASLRAEWVCDGTICLPSSITKNKREHTFPIGTLSASLLIQPCKKKEGLLFSTPHSDKPFNGWSKSKDALDKKANIVPWTLHDLRRTYATTMQRLGVRLEVTEALLNHVSGTRGGIVGVYQKHTYAEEMREAVALYEAHLLTILKE